MTPAQKYNPDLYTVFGVTGDGPYRIEGPTGTIYSRFMGVYRVWVRPHGVNGRNGLRRSGWRALPPGPLRVTLDSAITKAEKSSYGGLAGPTLVGFQENPMAKPTQGSLDTTYSVGTITLDAAGTIKKNGKTVGNATSGFKGGKPVVVVYVPPTPPVTIPADDPNMPDVTDTVIATADALSNAPPLPPVPNTTLEQTPETTAASSGTSDGFNHVGPMYHGNH